MSELAWRRTAQAHQPIGSVRNGQLKKSYQSSRVHQEAKARFSAKQIHRTDILRRIYKIGWSESYRPIRSLGQILSRYIMVTFFGGILKIGWSESYRPIRSLGQLLNRYIMVTFFGESTRSDGQNRNGQSYHLDGYLTVIDGHSLRRHPQDRTVRP